MAKFEYKNGLEAVNGFLFDEYILIIESGVQILLHHVIEIVVSFDVSEQTGVTGLSNGSLRNMAKIANEKFKMFIFD